MYLNDSRLRSETTRYVASNVDLGGNVGEETVVYLTGQSWCGSGACTLLILERVGLSYRVKGRTPITRTPIRILETRTNGWRDLGVWVQGGGVSPGYEAVLPFDGKRYASNPTVAPAHYVQTSPARFSSSGKQRANRCIEALTHVGLSGVADDRQFDRTDAKPSSHRYANARSHRLT
jgi:hypothetical protein